MDWPRANNRHSDLANAAAPPSCQTQFCMCCSWNFCRTIDVESVPQNVRASAWRAAWTRAGADSLCTAVTFDPESARDRSVLQDLAFAFCATPHDDFRDITNQCAGLGTCSCAPLPGAAAAKSGRRPPWPPGLQSWQPCRADRSGDLGADVSDSPRADLNYAALLADGAVLSDRAAGAVPD